MMVHKALLFEDYRAVTATLRERSPAVIKAIGRRVKGYDDPTWAKTARNVVFAGNMAKFTQLAGYREYLLKTQNAEIVEASPTDCRWGIGLAEDDPAALDPTGVAPIGWAKS